MAFKDKVAVVTGGGSGIGRALCEKLAAAGAKVLVSDIDEYQAKAVASAITSMGGKALAHKTDVTKSPQVRELVQKALDTHGRLDYMFNNAGVGVGGEARDLTLKDWKRVLDVNLWGVIHGVDAAYPVMIRQGHGHIVNTASVAGLVAAPGLLPYTTSKFAVVGLSRALRIEGRALGVKVSAACPGFVDTGIFYSFSLPGMDIDELLDKLPMRMPSPEKAADHILAGVKKNREIIFATSHAKPLYWFSQKTPRAFRLAAEAGLYSFRRMRQAKAG
ncbi:MAG: SDR family oxidoreductase [Deltaproteobacteria bacterium]|nr:SDR family oxidoreductase [Deltaproteobacteria bacterium]